MSPLLVEWAPYDAKGAELGRSHFIGWQACGMWVELNISSWIRVQFLKKEARFILLFSFLFSN